MSEILANHLALSTNSQRHQRHSQKHQGHSMLIDATQNSDRILRQVLKAEWREGALKGSEIWLGWHGWKCLRQMRLRLCM